MNPAKTCAVANKMLSFAVVKYTWHDGPWTVSHLSSPYFAVGSSMNCSMVEEWAKANTQSAAGQSLAVQIGNETFDKTGKKLNLEVEWPRALVACALWVKVKDLNAPKLMLTPDTIGSLDRTLMTDETFTLDLARSTNISRWRSDTLVFCRSLAS